jgi:predicted metal-dependent hydrolase
MKPDFVPSFTRGVEHFNALEFWEAHESWEDLWLVAESDVHQFLQGLIQIAAAYHHVKRGTFRGAVRLFEAGLKKLAAFPTRYCGIDRTDVERASAEHRVWAADLVARSVDERLTDRQYPKLSFVKPLDEAPMPPSSSW